MYGCQQVLIKSDKSITAILEYLCTEAKKLTNCGVYYSRQMYFKTGYIPSRPDLHKQLGTYQKNVHYQALYSDTSQQILTSVAESFKSYIELVKAAKKGEVSQKPKLPNYCKSVMTVATFTGRSLKLIDGMIRFPLGTKVKAWFGIDSFCLPMPSNLDFKSIREVRILPRNRQFYAEFVYQVDEIKSDVDRNNVLGIDHGLNNWLTCVSNLGTSFIVDGLHLKSLNQWYNKSVAKLKSDKPQGFWSNRLAAITEKRNRQMRDAVNKAARIVVNHCIENKIGAIVFGWNKGQKDSIDLGSKNNQKFVQIPTARLKDRIAQLCKQYGIDFIETEESYTSQSSFFDCDNIPKFGEKPEGWKASGKRVSRGVYETSDGFKINADCNGAANILKKVAVMLGIDLSGISRGCLSQPQKVRLWTLQKSPCL
ncbi:MULTISPECIES: RNA-guided endonuclease InsQ/TnpB family protein [Cylindrospermopsis]|uniref:IS200/IS605 family element transposase accessory protein TnpB n=1 Tax=Cylindrospermopsis curvispora GIHE-G1 TaxID=2666332 RepID=A0A7H0F5C3_9CYAN|nr:MULTISPECIES: RNA-guided endonuclease TnpB family protein [Cylindrospermopsis]QNP31239.1 IS200/IS605 family element transposase accessory protein TnpB [Cylindrospermopsis curvispora GIHE-G1]TPX29910.1 IS200/IS605 family element transposase accessory protein TnpB [Cylindrospermopsis raciborskii GIHE 2018]